MIENWKPVPDYEGLYEISDLGKIKSLDRIARNGPKSGRLVKGQIILPHVRGDGYHTVKLAKFGRKTGHYIHRIVCTTFHGEGVSGQEVLHGDGNKGNNISGNLRWGTRKDNMADRVTLGENAIGESHGRAKLTERQVRCILADTRWHKIIASDFHVSRSLVSKIKRKQSWKHIHG